MKRLQPVIWRKGTALAPQHLQVQDRFLESTLRFQMEALHFRAWGFQSLRIDQEALAGGNFGISSASGIFPDGLLFDIPHSDAPPPLKPLADAFDEDHSEVKLYLAIPEYRERGLNIAATQSNTQARYSAETTLLRDENTGLAERPVQVARKNFRLLTESELRDGYSALHVADVRRSPAGLYQTAPNFVPPLVDFHASDFVMSILRRLVEITSAKSTQIASQRRHKNNVLADFTASEIPNFWLLYTINSHFPVLNHLFESQTGHPERLFNAMLAMAGTLSTFSKDVQPHDLPRYDHENLAFCFSDLDSKIRLLLDTVIPSNFVSLSLKLVQPSIYATALDDNKYLTNTRMYLAVSAEMDQGELIEKVPHLVKVCSANRVEQLVGHALPGLKMTYTSSPPSAIPVKLKYKYFSLDQSGSVWDAISTSRNLAAYIPGDFPNPQLELVILLPAK